MADKKKLGIEGLGTVWTKVFGLIRQITGNVDVENKGDLQTQIDTLSRKVPAAAKNGRLTIQKNGSRIQDFTADQSGDVTANITVPNVTNSAAVTQAGQLALDAIEKNASIDGTLANEISKINSKFSGNTPFSVIFRRNYDYKTASGWKSLMQWYDQNGRTGYLQEYISDGKVGLYLQNEKGDVSINGCSIAWLKNSVDKLINNLYWTTLFAEKEPGVYELISYTFTLHELLFVYGYVLQVSKTFIVPANGFSTEGTVVINDTTRVEYVDATHVKLIKPSNDNYTVRIFAR